MFINGGFLTGSIPFSVKGFVFNRSFLINHTFKRQFKNIYRLTSAKKILDNLKRSRELEIYKSRIVTFPNILTVSRLTMSPLFPWLILNGHTKYAFGLLVYCGISDILDGWIARKFDQKSVLGSILDPVADKMTVLIFSSSLLLMGHIPHYLGALIISKDLLMLISGFVLRFRSLRRYSLPLNRFFDPRVASIEVKPLLISKINTVLQFLTLGACLSPIGITPLFLKTLQISTSITTAFTALMHCFQYRKVIRKIKP